MRTVTVKAFVALCLPGMFLLVLHGQNPAGVRGAAPAPPTPGLEEGTLDFETPDFTLQLVKASQTVAAPVPWSRPACFSRTFGRTTRGAFLKP